MVFLGELAVLNATVGAIITRPLTIAQSAQLVDTSQLILSDNGLDPDITANDGVYSAYFVDFTSSGRYMVKVLLVFVKKTLCFYRFVAFLYAIIVSVSINNSRIVLKIRLLIPADTINFLLRKRIVFQKLLTICTIFSKSAIYFLSVVSQLLF